jgi:fucose 4-O-acetylase-like acetyltransferase
MSAQQSTRDPWLDNAKMALVTLVVIGHAWTLLPGGGLVGHLYDFLYVWHLPAFVLVTGYLSRRFTYTRARMWSLTRTVVVPYIIFECLLALFRVRVGGEHLEDLFADPHWPMWYLAALVFWRLLTPIFLAMPASVGLTIAVALSLGSGLITGPMSDLLDLTRVTGLLPFFVLGLHATPSGLERLRAPSARWFAAGTFTVFWVVTSFVDELASTEWLYYRTPYEDLGVGEVRGMATRLVLLVLAVAGSFAFLALVPRVAGWFARLGAMTLVVYLCHGFVVLGLEYGGYTEWAETSPVLAPIVTFFGALALALVLASPPVSRWLLFLVDPFGRAEQQVKEAVQLTAVAQDPGNLPAMEKGQTQLAGR